MPSPAQEAYRIELEAEKALLLPQLEGWRDFSRTNLEGPTAALARDRIATWERRIALINGNLEAIRQLTADGYTGTGIPVLDIEPGVHRDLAANVATVEAAFGTVRALAGEAVTGTIEFGDPVASVR